MRTDSKDSSARCDKQTPHLLSIGGWKQFFGVLMQKCPQPTAEVLHDEMLKILVSVRRRYVVHVPEQLPNPEFPGNPKQHRPPFEDLCRPQRSAPVLVSRSTVAAHHDRHAIGYCANTGHSVSLGLGTRHRKGKVAVR